MSKLLTTPFETKLQAKDAFIDESGKIIKGTLKNAELYLTDMDRNEKGDLVLRISKSPFTFIDNVFHFDVVIPRDNVGLYFQTKNLTEALVYNTLVKEITRPIALHIATTASDLALSMFKDHSCNPDATRRERKEFAKRFFIEKYDEGILDTPPEIFDTLNDTPVEFLNSLGVYDLLKTQLFSDIVSLSKNFETPEQIIALRAVTNKTVLDLVEVLDGNKDLNCDVKIFENGLRTLDLNLERSAEKG